MPASSRGRCAGSTWPCCRGRWPGQDPPARGPSPIHRRPIQIDPMQNSVALPARCADLSWRSPGCPCPQGPQRPGLDPPPGACRARADLSIGRAVRPWARTICRNRVAASPTASAVQAQAVPQRGHPISRSKEDGRPCCRALLAGAVARPYVSRAVAGGRPAEYSVADAAGQRALAVPLSCRQSGPGAVPAVATPVI